jgi:hypothetical protein
MYIHMIICVYIYTSEYEDEDAQISTLVAWDRGGVCAYMYVYIYICIYIHSFTHMYKYVYIYIYTHKYIYDIY